MEGNFLVILTIKKIFFIPEVVTALATLLIICFFLACPHQGEAQYPFSYTNPSWTNQGFSSWGNLGISSFSSFSPYSSMNYSPAGFSGALPNNPYGGYGGYSPSSYGLYGQGSYAPYGPFGSPYAPYSTNYPTPPPIPDDEEYEYVSAVEARGEYVYLAVSEDFGEDNCQYIWVVDVSDPDNPDRVKRISVGHYPSLDLYLHENYLYWISHAEGYDDFDYDIDDEDIVGVFDISNPANPSLIDTLKIDIEQANFPVATFNNDRFYLLYSDFDDEDMEDEGILVQIDISTPGNLNLLSTAQVDFKNNITINQIAVKDNLAFMAAHDIYIFDISDPQNPSRINRFDYDKGRIKDLALLDHFLLGTASEEGLLIIDIESPDDPQLISVVEMAWPRQIFLKDQKAYVSDYCKGLYCVDLLDPTAPEIIHGYRLPSHKLYESTDNSASGYLSDAAVEGDMAFTVSRANLQIWDISEKENIKMTEKIGPSHETLGPIEEIIEGKLIMMLTKEAVSMISLGHDDDIATFGINSLDELNNDFDVSKITQLTSSGDAPALIDDLSNYKERTFMIEFSKSNDTFEVWDTYMDNPYCLIAEFSYEPNRYTNGGGYGIIPYYSPGGYGGSPFLPGGYGGYGGGYGGYGFSPFNTPSAFSMYPTQGYTGIYSPQYYPADPWSTPGLINSPSWGQSSVFPSLNQNPYTNFQNPVSPWGNNQWSSTNFNPINTMLNPMWNNTWNNGPFGSFPMGGFSNPYTGFFGF